MSEVKIIRTEKRVRGLFGKIIKWTFIVFNVLMVAWLLSYCTQIGHSLNSASSDAETAGTAIGGTLGVGFLMFFWVAGDIILGLFVLLTRGKKIIVEETATT